MVIPVLTKADKLKRGERGRQLKHLTETVGLAADEVIWFSTVTHEGRERLWARLLERLGELHTDVPVISFCNTSAPAPASRANSRLSTALDISMVAGT